MLLSLSLYHRSTCRAALGAGTFGFPSAKCISNVRHLPSLRLLVEAFLWLVPNLMSFLVGCGTRGWPRQIIEIINVIDFATPTNQCGQCKETVRLLNCRQLVQLWHTPRLADVAAYQLKLHLQFCHLLLLVVGGGGGVDSWLLIECQTPCPPSVPNKQPPTKNIANHNRICRVFVDIRKNPKTNVKLLSFLCGQSCCQQKKSQEKKPRK